MFQPYVGVTGDFQRRINNHNKDLTIKEPVGEYVNVSSHNWEDMTVVVINHTELIVPFLTLINVIIEKGFDLLCLDKRNEAIFI